MPQKIAPRTKCLAELDSAFNLLHTVQMTLGRFWAFLLLVGCCLACSAPTPTKEPEADSRVASVEKPAVAPSVATRKVKPPAEDTFEYKVAVIDYGPVDRNGKEAKRVRKVLNRLKKKTGMTDQEICDKCVRGREILVEKGVRDENVVELMEHIDKSDPKGATRDLTGLITLYIVLRTSGKE